MQRMEKHARDKDTAAFLRAEYAELEKKTARRKVYVRSRRSGNMKAQITIILHKTAKTIVFDLFDDIIMLWSTCNP